MIHMLPMLLKLKAYFAHILSTLAVLLGIGSVVYVSRVPTFGAGTAAPCRQIGVSKWQCTTGTDWKLCAADSSITCVPPAIPTPADASLENVFLLADFQATGVTCDGGFPCMGVIRRYMPGMNAGGIFVTPQWSTLDTPIGTDLSGPLGASTATIQYVSGQPGGSMYCPIASAVSCVLDIDYGLAYNAGAYDANLPDAGDAGSDAADAADAADAFDGGPPPTISGFALTAQNFGSAANYTPGTLPVLNGTNFTGATSVLLDGVEHVSNVTVASTTITFNTLALSGHTPAAYKNVVVVTPSGTATWGQPHGDGALTGWTTVFGGAACAVADWVTFGTPPAIATFIQLCDLSFTPTQATAGNQANQATGGSGINGFAVAQVAHVADTYPFASLAAFAAGDGILVGSQKSGAHSFTPWQIGNAAAADTWLPLNTGNLYSNFGVSTTYWCSAQAPVAPVTTATFASPFMSEEQMTSGGVGTLWANGTQQCTSGGHTAAFPATPSLLASSGAPQTGLPEVAAWFLFNSALSAANADVVYAYAGGRYNISYVAR